MSRRINPLSSIYGVTEHTGPSNPSYNNLLAGGSLKIKH